MTNLDKLRDRLARQQPGLLDNREYEPLLALAWDDLTITSGDQKMSAYKVLNRVEKLSWNPPFMTFDIERHGATVGGSIYGEVHSWTINTELGTATLADNVKRRQLYPKAAPLKTRPLAETIAQRILDGSNCSELIWRTPTDVRLDIEEIIPATNAQTTGSRRKRFRTELQEILKAHGWSMSKINRFEKDVKITERIK